MFYFENIYNNGIKVFNGSLELCKSSCSPTNRFYKTKPRAITRKCDKLYITVTQSLLVTSIVYITVWYSSTPKVMIKTERAPVGNFHAIRHSNFITVTHFIQTLVNLKCADLCALRVSDDVTMVTSVKNMTSHTDSITYLMWSRTAGLGCRGGGTRQLVVPVSINLKYSQ